LRTYLEEKGEITAGEFRDLLHISRKYAIPLLEHFDNQRLTVRLGDKRVLRKTS
jgi:selenocysteine-specific elongation factor